MVVGGNGESLSVLDWMWFGVFALGFLFGCGFWVIHVGGPSWVGLFEVFSVCVRYMECFLLLLVWFLCCFCPYLLLFLVS